MADFKIKSAAGTGNKTLIQGQDQSGSNYAIQIGDAGASTLHNATITAGTFPEGTPKVYYRVGTSGTADTTDTEIATGHGITFTGTNGIAYLIEVQALMYSESNANEAYNQFKLKLYQHTSLPAQDATSGLGSAVQSPAGGSWLGDNWQSNASKAGSFNVPFLCSYTGTGASVSFHLTLQGKNSNVTAKLYDTVWKLTENVVATQLTGG